MNGSASVGTAQRFFGFDLGAFAAILLTLYLTVYLFVQYITSFVPVTLHTLVLLPGAAVGALIALRSSSLTSWARPGLDWVLFATLVLLFLVSTMLINRDMFVWLDARAYFLSFLAFFFVRVASAYLPSQWLHRLLTFFLTTSGILILCQVYLGMDYYVATYLGGRISTLYGTGFATMTNLAGVMILWPLAIHISKMAVPRVELPAWYEWSAIVLGTIGLFFTLSRAAIAGLGVVLVVLLMVRVLKGKSIKRAVMVAGVVSVSLAAAYFAPSPLDRYISAKTSGELESYDPGPAVVVSPRGTATPSTTVSTSVSTSVCDTYTPMSNSYSLNTRLLILRVSRQVLSEHPLWGAGVARFREYYATCFERLPRPVQERLDPRARMTTHNAYLEGATDAGILFVGVLVVLIVWVSRQIWDCGPDHMAFHLFLGLLAVMVWMGTHDFLKERLFWIALAFPLAYLPRRKQMADFSKPRLSGQAA